MIRKEDIKFLPTLVMSYGEPIYDDMVSESEIDSMDEVPAITIEWFDRYMDDCPPEDRKALERLKTAWDEDPYVD